MDFSILSSALDGWRAVLGAQNVVTSPDELANYGACTTGITRSPAAALKPASVDDVVAVLEVSRQYGVGVHPISTGHNWGLGSSNPVLEGGVVLDLSGMARIIGFDPVMGLLTLEPGVTQAQLRHFLDENGHDFMVPVTGGGPHGSLIGNALERGVFMTPYSDHFGAVSWIEAVLPDGSVYRGSLAEGGGSKSVGTLKWGLGPYLDGLFAQWNLGIVTKMTIALAPTPERIEAFAFAADSDDAMEGIVAAGQTVLTDLFGVASGFTMMSRDQIIANSIPYPKDEAVPGKGVPDAVLARIGRENNIPAWSGFGALYGDKAVVRAARKSVRKRLGQKVDRLVFMDRAGAARASRLLSVLPIKIGRNYSRQVAQLNRALGYLHGIPGEMTLGVAYWRSGTKPATGPLNPAHDGCGLIWYLPIVPLVPDIVRAHVDMVRRVCTEYGFVPLLHMTTMSTRCFSAPSALLFDRSDPDETSRAQACNQALLDGALELGILPYRLGIQNMATYAESRTPFWDLAHTIKTAVDPGNLIAPGRYGRT